VVNSDIAQFVEIRPDGDRFLRLLEILGEWYEAGKIIIFVHTQDKCDNLFRDLLKVGCMGCHHQTGALGGYGLPSGCQRPPGLLRSRVIRPSPSRYSFSL
jgi:hypothetical protein